jgi:hypothetical protein
MGDMTDNKRKKYYDKHYGKRRKRELTMGGEGPSKRI